MPQFSHLRNGKNIFYFTEFLGGIKRPSQLEVVIIIIIIIVLGLRILSYDGQPTACVWIKVQAGPSYISIHISDMCVHVPSSLPWCLLA